MNKIWKSFSFCLALLVVISCQKDSVDRVKISEQHDFIQVWGESANGRWIPYILNQIQEEQPNSSVEERAVLFSRYLKVLENAEKTYRYRVLIKDNREITDERLFMDSIYRKNYERINKGMAAISTMDSLWNVYSVLSPARVPPTSKYLNAGSMKLAWNGIPEVGVSACGIPNDIAAFGNPQPTDGFSCQDRALQSIANWWNTLYNFRNPTSNDCANIINSIRSAITAYYSCNPTGPGNGGGGSPTDPYPPSGGSGGGGNGSGGGSNAGTITDDLGDFPCAQGILNSLPVLKTGITSKINEIFGGDRYNINFIAIEYPNDDLDGKTYSGNPNAEIQQYTVGLDSTLLRTATKEYILATMYHEIIHAFFYAEQHNNPTQFGILYPGIQPYTIGGTTKYIAVEGHANMIDYIDIVKQSILDFNPGFPNNKAEALAKAGIILINNSEKQINDDEKRATSNSSGQKCPTP